MSLGTAVVLAAASLPAAASTSLFGTAAAPARAAAAGDRVIRALDADRTTASWRVVDVAAAAVSSTTPRLLLDLAPGLTLEARRDDGYANADGTVVWIGSTPSRATRFPVGGHDPGNAVILVRNGDNVAGTVRTGGRLFRLEPLAGRGHALVEIDESAWPADHPPGAAPQPPAAVPAGLGVLARPGPIPRPNPGSVPRRTPEVTPPTTTRTRIDAMVVITASAAAAVGDPQAFIQLAIAETNQGYRNSWIPIDMHLAGWYQTAYATADFSTDLSRFQGTADGFLDEYHGIRNQIGADVNILLIRDPAYQYCGLAYLNASAAYAFSVTDHRCATGNYTFAHEIGHNQGAHHDPANAANSYFAYGHGYQMQAHGWRTVMAYACSGTPACPRINAWSNPKRFRSGVAMGTGDRSNNARVLDETRGRVAGFR